MFLVKTCVERIYLPGHVGKSKKPGAHASHLAFMILALQLHIPLPLHVIPFDPSPLQLQAEFEKA